MAAICLPVFAEEIPSLQDEIDAYASRGITYPGGLESDLSFSNTYTGPVGAEKDIHGVTEGDELWMAYAHWQRRGQPEWKTHARQWRDYFEQYYVGSSYWKSRLSEQGSAAKTEQMGNGLDHLFGWGLIDWYVGEGDREALAVAERILLDARNRWFSETQGTTPNEKFAATEKNGRKIGRHLLLAVRVAEHSTNADVISFRDHLVDLMKVTPSWDENQGGSKQGMYVWTQKSATDLKFGDGAWDSGIRGIQSFHAAMIAEGLWHAFRTTGDPVIADRLVKMAYWVKEFGFDADHVGAWDPSRVGMTLTNMGTRNGTTLIHAGNVRPDGVMTISLVNTLVYGYKLTGDTTLLDRAWHHFMHWQKLNGGSTSKLHHFVDTKFSGYHLQYNMGEFQYCYRLFENGGHPTVVHASGDTPKPPVIVGD
jgi:hypothetical protein